MTLFIEHAEQVTITLHGDPASILEALANVRRKVGGDTPATPWQPRGPTPERRDAAAPADDLQPPAPGEIWHGHGGIYVGTVPPMLGLPGRHLVVATAEAQRTWGPYGQEFAGARSHVDGVANTRELLASSDTEFPAAAWCAEYTSDGHKDFHLPSRFDLFFAFLSAPQVFDKEGYYWTSTQDSAYYAFVQDFATGYSGWYAKANEWRVRPFRWIHFNP